MYSRKRAAVEAVPVPLGKVHRLSPEDAYHEACARCIRGLVGSVDSGASSVTLSPSVQALVEGVVRAGTAWHPCLAGKGVHGVVAHVMCHPDSSARAQYASARMLAPLLCVLPDGDGVVDPAAAWVKDQLVRQQGHDDSCVQCAAVAPGVAIARCYPYACVVAAMGLLCHLDVGRAGALSADAAGLVACYLLRDDAEVVRTAASALYGLLRRFPAGLKAPVAGRSDTTVLQAIYAAAEAPASTDCFHLWMLLGTTVRLGGRPVSPTVVDAAYRLTAPGRVVDPDLAAAVASAVLMMLFAQDGDVALRWMTIWKGWLPRLVVSLLGTWSQLKQPCVHALVDGVLRAAGKHDAVALMLRSAGAVFALARMAGSTLRDNSVPRAAFAALSMVCHMNRDGMDAVVKKISHFPNALVTVLLPRAVEKGGVEARAAAELVLLVLRTALETQASQFLTKLVMLGAFPYLLVLASQPETLTRAVAVQCLLLLVSGSYRGRAGCLDVMLSLRPAAALLAILHACMQDRADVPALPIAVLQCMVSLVARDDERHGGTMVAELDADLDLMPILEELAREHEDNPAASNMLKRMAPQIQAQGA